ncbi:ImmA/IrrE family metallo-endopeptidase [Pseudomonas mangiferae]|uniref:ImmA/IrrE family metallo-endopeptidase n=1 Tax=Pseudomonas mangiferae TaxID=2593654 RepID=A0A553H1M4_9PSED|nr:ImmA/IrrE family metallo-endopeptidase [Pseudomonas mangiferae]TRX75655.1 ImmA/IrrE family metallo-endopeptidase [Pseudomonas mangiferae]
MFPEEKLAARTLLRHKLNPPYDLEKLASDYGDIKQVVFPFKADGVTVGIGSAERPTIYINIESPATRRKFTLAHELGHIIIPWHTGTVVSHLENKKGEYAFEYERMEQEANRFAAELLMPAAWIKDCYGKEKDFSFFLKSVIKVSGASRDAALIKIFSTIQDSIICARINEDGYAVTKHRTSSAPYPSILDTCSVYTDKIFQAEHNFYEFSLGDQNYAAWVFVGDEIQEVDDRSWREIIQEILSDLGMTTKLINVNSTMAAAFRKADHLDEKHACGSVINSFSTKDDLSNLVGHPLFKQYVVKRVKELFKRDQKKT